MVVEGGATVVVVAVAVFSLFVCLFVVVSLCGDGVGDDIDTQCNISGVRPVTHQG